MNNYFRELKKYSLTQIAEQLELDKENCNEFIGNLKKYGILHSIDPNQPDFDEYTNEQPVIADIQDSNKDIYYQFDFVGVVLLGKRIIKCYPKYIDNNLTPEKEFKQILKVIKKYNRKNPQLYLFNGIQNERIYNKLSLQLYLLSDYFENGLYTNEKQEYAINGEGPIDFQKTIDEEYAFIQDNTPVYLNYYTNETLNNDNDYITQLHKIILSECSSELKESGILELFEIPEVQFTNDKRDILGPDYQILYKLRNSIQLEYNDKKKNLLKSIFVYISNEKLNKTQYFLNLYGTNSFNLVWEKVCGETFGNIRDLPLVKIENLIGKIRQEDINKRNLKDFIEHAKWYFNKNAIEASKTLEPDILLIQNKDKKNFFILDAKYYFIEYDETHIYHQPGIQDVVKQFAYEKAYKQFLKNYNFHGIANAFLIPKKSSSDNIGNIINIGKVTLDLMQYYALKSLTDIQVIEIEPYYIYNLYLNNKTIETEISCINISEIEG